MTETTTTYKHGDHGELLETVTTVKEWEEDPPDRSFETSRQAWCRPETILRGFDERS